MTDEQFREWCEQILVPRMTELLGDKLEDMHATLDLSTRELIRIGRRLDRIEERLDLRDERTIE